MSDLRIHNLSKTYPNGVKALQHINLTVPKGMYGLLGPNGAGKSTLMRTIATLQEPDEGEIHLGEIDVVREKDELRKTLGYLPQEFGVYPKVTAERVRFLNLLSEPGESSVVILSTHSTMSGHYGAAA